MNFLETLYYALLCAIPTGWRAFKLVFKAFPSVKELPEDFEVTIDITVEMKITGE